jgi:choline-sulfatase
MKAPAQSSRRKKTRCASGLPPKRCLFNTPALWHKGNGTWLVEGKSGARPNMFEESIRVPLIMCWPGRIAPGTVIDRVVSNLDLFPTILEMAGIGVPGNLQVHGRSLVPLLQGKPTGWDDTLFGQYDMHHYQVARMRMIRTPDWKLIRHFEAGGQDELYHLAKDPAEMANLAASSDPDDQKSKTELTRCLREWMGSIHDSIPPG